MSREELVEKTRYYLAHGAGRAAIAEAGHERAVRDYDVMTAIPRLVALIDERRRGRRRRFSQICVDSHFERYYATFRVRMLARFILLGRWRYALGDRDHTETREDRRKKGWLFVFSVFEPQIDIPSLKKCAQILRKTQNSSPA